MIDDHSFHNLALSIASFTTSSLCPKLLLLGIIIVALLANLGEHSCGSLHEERKLGIIAIHFT
jgi:hypothetical protein